MPRWLPEGATLAVKVVFGGGQVLVPADWRVVANVQGLGGVQDVREAKGYAEGAPTLTIEGMVFAGGFAVQSELDEGSAKFYEGVTTARQAIDDATKKATDAVSGTIGTAKPDVLEVESDPEMTPAT